jgi:DNA-binding CsgD family transcriptional regulator
MEVVDLRCQGLILKEIATKLDINPMYAGALCRRATKLLLSPRPWPALVPSSLRGRPKGIKMTEEQKVERRKERARKLLDYDRALLKYRERRAGRLETRLAPFYQAALASYGLTAREAYVVDMLRFGYTLQMIGEKMGNITRERVRQIAKKGISRLQVKYIQKNPELVKRLAAETFTTFLEEVV